MPTQSGDSYHPSRAVPPPRRLSLRLRDGVELSLFLHSPPPAGPPMLPILYVHGIQSHPGWFAGSAAALAQAGHPVFQITRRGSGDPARTRPVDRGHADSPGQLLDDLTEAARLVAAEAGSTRMHLMGVSWGGKLLAAYVGSGRPRQAGLDIASLTLIAPGIVPRVDVGLATKLLVGLCLLCRPRRLFDIPLSDVDLFTDNPQMRQYLRDDPFRLHRATARFLYVSRQLDSAIRRLPAGAIEPPTRLILADRDRIIDNPATASAVARLTAGRAQTISLPGSHTLEFEPDPQPFFRHLAPE